MLPHLREQIDSVLDLVDFIAGNTSLLHLFHLLLWENCGVTISYLVDGPVVRSQKAVIDKVGAWPLVKVEFFLEDLAVEQRSNFDTHRHYFWQDLC